MARYVHLPIFQRAYDLNPEIYKTTFIDVINRIYHLICHRKYLKTNTELKPPG